MKAFESEKFEKYGSFFFRLLFGVGIVLPLLLALFLCISGGRLRWDVFWPFALSFAFIAWMLLLSLIAYGGLTSVFVKRTARGLEDLPYRFNSSFRSRGGTLYIDVEHGMIGLISAYNPKKIQIFDAARIGEVKTVASTTTGVRFVFYLDGKKITMYTLVSNRAVSLKSGIGAEAVSKADTFVGLLQAAKRQAESQQG